MTSTATAQRVEVAKNTSKSLNNIYNVADSSLAR